VTGNDNTIMAAVLSRPAHTREFLIRPFGAPLGAEIVGLDLREPLSAHDFERIRRAFLEHHVLVLRDQRISPPEQVAFTRRFGCPSGTCCTSSR